MRRNNVYFNGLVMVALITAILAFLPTAAQAGDEAKGVGTAEFDPGEELEGLTTDFAVDANVSDDPVVTNQCKADFDALGVMDAFDGVVGGNFMAADGYFFCTFPGAVEIVGRVTQGRENPDRTVTLCGTATFVNIGAGMMGEDTADLERPWAGTFRKNRKGSFIYYDEVTGPAGDAETVIDGKIKIRRRR